MTMKSFSFRDRNLTLAVTAVAALTLFAGACGKKKIPTPPPAPPPTAQSPGTPEGTPPGLPTATLTAEPNRIEAGQSATLRWTTTNANDVSISGGVGTVTATVTITAPPPPPVEARPTSNSMGTLESRVQSDLKDAFFDYDQVSIRDDA